MQRDDKERIFLFIAAKFLDKTDFYFKFITNFAIYVPGHPEREWRLWLTPWNCIGILWSPLFFFFFFFFFLRSLFFSPLTFSNGQSDPQRCRQHVVQFQSLVWRRRRRSLGIDAVRQVEGGTQSPHQFPTKNECAIMSVWLTKRVFDIKWSCHGMWIAVKATWETCLVRPHSLRRRKVLWATNAPRRPQNRTNLLPNLRSLLFFTRLKWISTKRTYICTAKNVSERHNSSSRFANLSGPHLLPLFLPSIRSKRSPFHSHLFSLTIHVLHERAMHHFWPCKPPHCLFLLCSKCYTFNLISLTPLPILGYYLASQHSSNPLLSLFILS